MSGEQRIRNSRDFHRVRATGARGRSDGLTVWVVPGRPESRSRVGLAPRSKRAVDRNRIRRRLREAWREIPASNGREIVVGADQNALEAEYQELVRHLKSALSRAEAGL